MTVLGIGGVFFRSRDPQARAAWYRQHLGIEAGFDTAPLSVQNASRKILTYG
ncbi:hypothetical protein [Microbacterium oleivorans]|uniref:hypothetical protein n=1 Tax=Microbacterium oleivorans TaxID=273677 RepID=UPI000A5B1954|nr:hypothetical protein [Microbacterium oleivorans]